jgi:hypothetical protein
VDLAQSGSRSTAVELIGLMPSWTTTALTSVYSQASSSRLRNAGAIRRPATQSRNNMIRTAIISVIASFVLVGVWTANLVSYHPATDLDPLAPLSVNWN